MAVAGCSTGPFGSGNFSMDNTKVYIDTNVFKFSATELLRLTPRKQSMAWGDKTHDVTVHDLVYVNPNERIQNPELKTEADLLPKVAELGKQGHLEFVVNLETMFESWGLPNMDSQTGKFYDAPYKIVDAPIKYSRILFGLAIDPRENQYNFLAGIKKKRLLEWQKLTGAYQGNLRPNRNQLLDAFHLWCAEYNGCVYFLTLDFKLIKVVRENTRRAIPVKLVRPSELLQEFGIKA